jgi:GTP-binding protein
MLKGAVVLIPAQKSLTGMDRWVLRMLAERNKRTLVILTKADMGGRDWHAGCEQLAGEIRDEMRRLERELDNGWREGDGWVSDIYATAAGWGRRQGGVGSAPGLGGARKAILEHLVGLTLEQKLETRPEDVTYGGEMVSWDDLLALIEE